ncbi:uncharacterized protein [Amphiura filiformis]|uniref:uncharacterized protein n=1 Tax=Amphiura filiformis TaxID=82378 RepID=UPI003B2175C2
MTVFDALPYSVCVEVFGPERTIETSTVLLIANGLGLILGSLFGMSVDASGSYDSAIYTSIGIYVFSLFLWTGVPIYQKIFAKDRYIMAEFKQMQREIKEEKKQDKILDLKQQYLDRTFTPPASLLPEYVYYEQVSTV